MFQLMCSKRRTWYIAGRIVVLCATEGDLPAAWRSALPTHAVAPHHADIEKADLLVSAEPRRDFVHYPVRRGFVVPPDATADVLATYELGDLDAVYERRDGRIVCRCRANDDSDFGIAAGIRAGLALIAQASRAAIREVGIHEAARHILAEATVPHAALGVVERLLATIAALVEGGWCFHLDFSRDKSFWPLLDARDGGDRGEPHGRV